MLDNVPEQRDFLAGAADAAPIVADVFPGDAAERAATAGASASARAEAARPGWRVLGILSALMGFASISTDLYLPAMPAMGRALGASAGMMEWSVSGYLIGFSLGQLLWRPISDRRGRRLPVALGLVLFVIGSAGCALAGGACASVQPAERRNHEPLWRAPIRYGSLLRDRRLLGYAGAGGFFYGGMFAYIAGTPFAYITYHHVAPQLYGLLFSVGIVGVMVTNIINSRLVTRLGGDRLLVRGASAAAP